MTCRRHYLRYRERHRAKLGKGLEGGDDSSEDALSETMVTSLAKQQEQLSDVHSESGASRSSHASSIITSGSLMMPEIPPEANNGRSFECPYCYVVIAVRDTVAWHKHICEDLQPYVCIVQGCPTSNVLYSTQREWARHLKENHPKTWMLTVPPGMELLNLDELSVASTECCLCHETFEKDKVLLSHLASHLQELALFVLPREVHEVHDEQVEEPQHSSSAQITQELDLHKLVIEDEELEVGVPRHIEEKDSVTLPKWTTESRRPLRSREREAAPLSSRGFRPPREAFRFQCKECASQPLMRIKREPTCYMCGHTYNASSNYYDRHGRRIRN